MQNYLKFLHMHKKFSSSNWYKKMNIFIFPMIKMAAKYAKIDRVGSLVTDFELLLD